MENNPVTRYRTPSPFLEPRENEVVSEAAVFLFNVSTHMRRKNTPLSPENHARDGSHAPNRGWLNEPT